MKTEIKTLLVPVDFTEKSNNAVTMAVHMAGRHEARIILFHHFSNYYIIDRTGKQAVGTDTVQENFALAEKGLREMKHSAEKQNPLLKVDSVIGNSTMIDSLNECIVSENVDLVVAGTSGKQRIREFFLGSASYEILTGAHCSVLLVPENCHTYDFEKILVPVRVTEHLHEKMVLSQTIARKNNAKISLLGVCKEEDADRIKAAYDALWETLSKGIIEYSTSFLLTKDKALQISRFSKIDHADIIILNYHDENNWKSLFSENFFKQVINLTDIPLFFMKDTAGIKNTTAGENKVNNNAGFDITLPNPG